MSRGSSEQVESQFLQTLIALGVDQGEEQLIPYREELETKNQIIENNPSIFQKNTELPELWFHFMDKGYYKFTTIESHASICVIEVVIEQLISLSGHDAKPHPPLPNIKERSNVTHYATHKHIYDRNTLETKKQSAFRYQKCKIQIERHFIQRSLEETRLDLIATRTFVPIKETIGYLKLRSYEREKILQDNCDMQRIKYAQDVIIDTEYQLSMTANKKMDNAILRMRQNLHDAHILKNTCGRTVTKYESARREQHIMKLQSSERQLEESIEQNHSDTKRDNRINAEIVEFLLRQTRDLKNQITAWSERFDADIEELDTELLMKKESLESLRKALDQMKGITDRRQAELEEYLEIKHGKMFLAKQSFMALMIQSWWRGIAYRKNLMPKQTNKKKKGIAKSTKTKHK